MNSELHTGAAIALRSPRNTYISRTEWERFTEKRKDGARKLGGVATAAEVLWNAKKLRVNA